MTAPMLTQHPDRAALRRDLPNGKAACGKFPQAFFFVNEASAINPKRRKVF